MQAKEITRRYIVFFTALTIGACGVTLVTRSHLGVNSVACLKLCFFSLSSGYYGYRGNFI